MSDWKNLGHDSQRTSADPDGNISAVAEVWSRMGGTDNRNGWAGGVITDSDSVYYFYSSYYPNIGGTGDRFSLNRYDKAGNLKWANNATLGNHNDLGTWPTLAKAIVSGGGQADVIIYHEYYLSSVNKYTGVKAATWTGGDTYGNMVFNPSQSKMFGCRTFWNEGFQGYGWMKGFDMTIFDGPLHAATLWTRNADTGLVVDDSHYTGVGGNVIYDNSKVFYAPYYAGTNPNFHTGIYCWDEAGVEQWNVVSEPHSRMSAGNGMLYMMEYSGGHNNPDKSLVARSQTTGAIVWSVVISGYSLTAQPPVVVNNLVIMASSTGVHARNATTGAVEWDAAITDMDFPTDPNQRALYTVLAAAVISNTLVVCAKSGLYILSLTDGSQVQLYNPPSVTAAGTGARPVNPIVVDNRVYITVTFNTYSAIGPQTLICLEDGAVGPPPDTTPPSIPGSPNFSNVTTTSMTVSWGAATDNVGVTAYMLYWGQQGGIKSVVQKTTLNHIVTGLTPDTIYEFYVVAADAAGNLSDASGITTKATLAEPPPPPPPPEPPVAVQLSGTVSVDVNSGLKTVHTLNWNAANAVIVLQRRTSKVPYATIYQGSAPYSYIQPDMKTNYYYRLMINGATFSNEVVLRSSRK